MRSWMSVAAFLSVAASVSLTAAQDAAGPTEPLVVDVFKTGEAGRHGYRIPAVIVAPNGDVLAFSEGRQNSLGDAGNIDLVMKRSTDGGKSWSDMQTLWDDAGNTCGNPCPVVDATTKEMHLLLTHNLGQDHEKDIKRRAAKSTRTVWVMTSKDSGATWSAPREITKDVKRDDWGWYATGPGVGIQMQAGPHAGRLVIPCDHTYDTSTNPADVGKGWGSHVIYSDDHGATWKLGGLARPNANECQVAEITGGKLLLDMRSYAGKQCRLQAISPDGGESWSELKDATALVEPVCQASLIRLPAIGADGPQPLVFSNPADPKRRVKMTIRVSLDDGQTWPAAYTLHAGPAAYSCLTYLGDETVGCLYEAGEKGAYDAIRFARVPLSTILQAKAETK